MKPDNEQIQETLNFAEWCIENGLSFYYTENEVEKYIDDSKEVFHGIWQVYEKYKHTQSY